MEFDLPILNIEGDKLNRLDARTKLRLEAFLDMLSELKGGDKVKTLGIDLGSREVKMIIIDEKGQVSFKKVFLPCGFIKTFVLTMVN